MSSSSTSSPANAGRSQPATRRRSLRRLGALLCAVIAGVYVLIGTEVVTVAEATEEAGDIGVFGFGAAALFVVGAVLLLVVDRRILWMIGALLVAGVIGMYLAVAGSRTPAFEAWGLALRLPQLVLVAVLARLAMPPTSASAEGREVVDPEVVADFLAQRRLAVVGVSDDPGNFGRTVYGELRSRGYEVVPVSRSSPTVLGDAAVPDLASVAGDLEGVVVMVHRDRALPVVQAAIDRGVRRVWLFRGVGGAGAVSPESIELCARHGVSVVPGACPLMFLQPVATIHRMHLGIRHLDGSLARTA